MERVLRVFALILLFCVLVGIAYLTMPPDAPAPLMQPAADLAPPTASPDQTELATPGQKYEPAGDVAATR